VIFEISDSARQALWNFTIYPAGDGLTAFFRAGEGEDSEEEEWRPTSVT